MSNNFPDEQGQLFPDDRVTSSVRRPPGGGGPPPNNPPNDILKVLQEIHALNIRMAASMESTEASLQVYEDSLQRNTSLASAAKHRGSVSGADPYTPHTALGTPQLIERYDEKREAFFARPAEDQMTDLVNRFGIGHNEVKDMNQLERVVARITGKDTSQADPIDQALADKISRSVETGLTRQVALGASKGELRQAAGARRLQDLNVAELLTPAGLFKRVAGTLGLGGLIGAGGPGGGVVPNQDLLQEAMEAQKSGRRRQGMGDWAAEKLGKGAAVRGGVKGATVGLASRAALSIVPVAGQLLLATEILNQLGLPVPSISQMPKSVRDWRQSGQLTGEGVRAGFDAQWDARGIQRGGNFFAGINPFDPITNEIADQIVMSIRTEGFTGDRAKELYAGVASVYRDLGLSVEATSAMLVAATRVGGESLKQIVGEMKTFDTAAKSLGVNINEYAASVQSTSDKFRAGGAGKSSTVLAQQFVASAPRQMRTGAGLAAYTSIFDAASPQLAAQLGVPQQYLQLEANADAVAPAFEDALLNEIGRMPGDNLPERAANAARMGILFKGQSVDDIVAIMTRINEGRGPRGVSALGNVRQDYNTRLGNSVGTRKMKVSQIYSDLASQGDPKKRRTLALERYGLQGNQVADVFARMRDGGMDEEMTVRGDLSSINRDTLAHHRQAAINRLKGVLTPNQVKELQKNIRARGYNFAEKLKQFEGRGTSGSGDSMTVNGVTISLKGGASKWLRLDANKNQVRQGLVPSNRAYPTESYRVDPDPFG